MPLIEYETVKNIDCKDTDFKIGDIVVGTSHMYRTKTYWYKVIKITSKQMVLEEFPISYPTEYMSNTPGDYCAPVIKIKDDYYVNTKYPYWIRHMTPEIIKVKPYKIRRYEIHYLKNGKTKKVIPKDSKWEYRLHIMGNKWLPSLKHWDGDPGWVNCD